jgi:hypothetical protein
LTLESNDPDQPVVTVTLQGEAIPPPEIAVAPLRLDEDLLLGRTSTRSLQIANGGGSPLTVQLSLRPPVAHAVATLTATTAHAGGAPPLSHA